MQVGEAQRARQAYENAWNLLSERDPTGQKLEKRQAELESIIALRQAPLPDYIGDAQPTGIQETDHPIKEGSITMSYSISERGRVTNLKLIEQRPSAFMEFQRSAQRLVRRTLFRPRFEDGEAVPTENQVLVHTFYYRQSDLDAANKAIAEEDEST